MFKSFLESIRTTDNNSAIQKISAVHSLLFEGAFSDVDIKVQDFLNGKPVEFTPDETTAIHYLTNKDVMDIAERGLDLDTPEEPNEMQMADGGAGIFLVCPKTGKMLLGKRSNDGDAPGTWANFGGKVEDGETPLQAAKREVEEESQLAPTSYKLFKQPLDVSYNEENDFYFVTYLGITDSELEHTIDREHSDSGWFSFDDIKDLELHPGVASSLNKNRVLNRVGLAASGQYPLPSMIEGEEISFISDYDANGTLIKKGTVGILRSVRLENATIKLDDGRILLTHLINIKK